MEDKEKEILIKISNMDSRQKESLVFRGMISRKSNKIKIQEVSDKMVGYNSIGWISEIEKRNKKPSDEYLSSYISAIQKLTREVLV